MTDTHTHTHMTLKAVYFWITLTLPLRIALFVAHVYLVNMAAMVKLVSLSLRVFIDLLIYTNQKIKAQLEHADRPQPALIHALLSRTLKLSRSLLVFVLTGMRLLQLQSDLLLEGSQFLRSWASAQTWLIKLLQR